MDRAIAYLSLFAAALVGLAAPAPVGAQDYPSKPIKFVVPTAPAGIGDMLPRLFQQKLGEAGNPATIVVENRAGAAGVVGTDSVAKAAPDGYTLLVGNHGVMSMLPHLQKIPYDPFKSFEPVILLVTVPNILVVHPSVPAKSVQELVAYAKANPGKLTYASQGVGASGHIAAELFKLHAGIDITHVPYKGAAQQLTDVTAKQVTMTFTSVAAAQQFIKSGQLRPIAVTSAKRVASLPDVPAIAEFKPLAAYELVNWFGLFAPAKTPDAVIKKVNAAVTKALRDQDLVKKLEAQGAEPAPSTPEEFRQFVGAESKKFAKIIADANVKLEN
jgi:tripartite-type tricarboxylate transporter receptor subunit TctC